MHRDRLRKSPMKQQATRNYSIPDCIYFVVFASTLLLAQTQSAQSSVNRRDNYHQPLVNHNQNDNTDQLQETNQDSSASLDSNAATESTDTSALYHPPHDMEIVRLNDTSVVLKWDIPYAAHEHLQFFKIQYKPTRKDAIWKTETRETPPTTRAHQINGLRPGNYFFIVSAVYDNDDNVSSEQTKYRLRARSKIPADEMPELKAPQIYWSTAESDYIRFKWKYTPKEKDMPYFGYLVYYRSAHAVTDFTIYNTLDESVEIAELEPETPYEAKVVAYNQNGVSEFSDIIRIKTKAKTNSTTTTTVASPSLPQLTVTTTTTSTTTRKPNQALATESPPSHNHMTSVTSTPKHQPVGTSAMPSFFQTTPRPISGSTPIFISDNNNQTQNVLALIIEFLVGGRNETGITVRYSLLILLPIIFIVSASICLISCHQRRKDSPPSSTHDSQNDFEVNHFKNSFPGVAEEYSPISNHYAHNGFVNNHPHINDLA